MAEPSISNFERLKISMEAVVPLIREFEAAFGKKAVREVLEARGQRGLDAAESNAEYKTREPDFDKARVGIELFAAGEALHYEVIACDTDSLQFDVKDCQYAAMMADLDATDLGGVLVCDGDFAAAYRSGMELTRTQTRMQGATHCDFRYRRR